MAQKKKASQVTPELVSTEDIASRLSSASELIGTTEAEAEQQRQQTRAQIRETEESAQARMSESERRRSEAAEAAKSVAERKLAALSYAENYRERMQTERAKARKQKQADEQRAREEEEARQREERQDSYKGHVQLQLSASVRLRAVRDMHSPCPQALPF